MIEEISKQIDVSLAEGNKRSRILLSEAKDRLLEVQELLGTSDMQTDKSENAAYEAAVNRRQDLEKQIGQLETGINLFDRLYAQYCYENYVPGELTSIGSTVRFVFDKGKEFTMKLVPEGAGSPINGGLSVESPTGESLVNRRVGEVINVSTDAVDTRLTIKEVY